MKRGDMKLNELKIHAKEIVDKFKDTWTLPKENHKIDFKRKLNIWAKEIPIDTLLRNLGKDIIAFANSDGGVIFLWFEEYENGTYWEVGLGDDNLHVLSNLDLNDIEQKIYKICKSGISIEIIHFRMWTKQFYYILVEKSENILIPINDYKDFKLNKWEKKLPVTPCTAPGLTEKLKLSRKEAWSVRLSKLVVLILFAL